MKHRKPYRTLGRPEGHRRSLLKNLVISLFRHGRIETTVAKAKETRRVAEKLITIAKKDTVHNRRQVLKVISSNNKVNWTKGPGKPINYNKEIVNKLFLEIGPKYKERPGGYTRVIKSRVRLGDAAEMALIELVN